MRTYIADIIPKIKRFSERLDNETLLINQHWVVIDEVEKVKNVYIFRKSGELLISRNGIVTKGSWEYLDGNSMLISQKEESYLFRHGFFDENILVLKLDSKEEYGFLVNESKAGGELNTLEKTISFLETKYLNPNTSKGKSNLPTQMTYRAPASSKTFLGTEKSLLGKKIVKYQIVYSDNLQDIIYVRVKNDIHYFNDYVSSSSSTIIHEYDNMENCINGLHYFLKNGKILRIGYLGAFS